MDFVMSQKLPILPTVHMNFMIGLQEWSIEKIENENHGDIKTRLEQAMTIFYAQMNAEDFRDSRALVLWVTDHLHHCDHSRLSREIMERYYL